MPRMNEAEAKEKAKELAGKINALLKEYNAEIWGDVDFSVFVSIRYSPEKQHYVSVELE